MKKKKGFTLVELLAVIVIIAVVALIGTVSMITIKKKMLKKTFTEELLTAVSAAETFGSDNKELVETAPLVEYTLDGNTAERHVLRVTLETLIEKDYFHLNCEREESDDKSDAEGNCKKEKVRQDDGTEIEKTVKTFNHYETNESINSLIFLVYETGESGRIKACIPTTVEDPTDTDFIRNEELLQDNAEHVEFGDAGIYCNPKNTAVTTPTVVAKISPADSWEKEKTITLISNKMGNITKYLITSDIGDCSKSEAAKSDGKWVEISGTSTSVNNIKVGNGASLNSLNRDFDKDGEELFACVYDGVNFTYTTMTIKKVDTTPPSCDDAKLMLGTNNYTPPNYIKKGETLTAKCTDISGCTAELPETLPTTYATSAPSKLNITLTDGAGNTTTNCEKDVYIDQKDPDCEQIDAPTETDWTNTARTVKYTCKDNESGCDTSIVETEEIDGQAGAVTKKASTTKLVVDYAGNSSTCEVVVNIDKTIPTCTFELSGETITLIKNDTNFGTKDEGYQKFGFLYTTWLREWSGEPNLNIAGNTTTIQKSHAFPQEYTGYLVDNAGNEGSCHMKIYKNEKGYSCPYGYKDSGETLMLWPCIKVETIWYTKISGLSSTADVETACNNFKKNLSAPNAKVTDITGDETNGYSGTCQLYDMKKPGGGIWSTSYANEDSSDRKMRKWMNQCDSRTLIPGNSNYCYELYD